MQIFGFNTSILEFSCISSVLDINSLYLHISCHQLPENYQGKSIRVRNKDDIEQNNELIEEMMENLTVLYKNRNSQLVSKHSLKGKKINSEREENEK